MHPTRKVRCWAICPRLCKCDVRSPFAGSNASKSSTLRSAVPRLANELARRAADPMAQLAEQQAMRSQEFGSQMAERQAGSDMSLMNRFGADMTAAVRASDPLMQARVNQANELANQAYRESQMTDLSPEMRRRATQSAREGLVLERAGHGQCGHCGRSDEP